MPGVSTTHRASYRPTSPHSVYPTALHLPTPYIGPRDAPGRRFRRGDTHAFFLLRQTLSKSACSSPSTPHSAAWASSGTWFTAVTVSPLGLACDRQPPTRSLVRVKATGNKQAIETMTPSLGSAHAIAAALGCAGLVGPARITGCAGRFTNPQTGGRARCGDSQALPSLREVRRAHASPAILLVPDQRSLEMTHPAHTRH